MAFHVEQFFGELKTKIDKIFHKKSESCCQYHFLCISQQNSWILNSPENFAYDGLCSHKQYVWCIQKLRILAEISRTLADESPYAS